jgi:hypothetical protein
LAVERSSSPGIVLAIRAQGVDWRAMYKDYKAALRELARKPYE